MDTHKQRLTGNIIPEAARWRGRPSRERILWIQENYYYDSDNDWGEGRGVLYKLIVSAAGVRSWIQVREFNTPPPIK